MLSRPLSRPNPFFSVLDIIGTEDNKTLLPRPIEVVPQGYLGIVTHSSIYAYLLLKIIIIPSRVWVRLPSHQRVLPVTQNWQGSLQACSAVRVTDDDDGWCTDSWHLLFLAADTQHQQLESPGAYFAYWWHELHYYTHFKWIFYIFFAYFWHFVHIGPGTSDILVRHSAFILYCFLHIKHIFCTFSIYFLTFWVFFLIFFWIVCAYSSYFFYIFVNFFAYSAYFQHMFASLLHICCIFSIFLAYFWHIFCVFFAYYAYTV